MKAFRFRLDSAHRWRSAQNDLEKSRVAAAAKRVQDLRAAIEARRVELAHGARQLTPVASGSALELWSAFTSKARRQIGELEKAVKKAEQDLAAQTQALLEANRKLRLVENLKQTAHSEWQGEFNRELEAFAAEAFLGRRN
jgi:flagellar export protein FliJ